MSQAIEGDSEADPAGEPSVGWGWHGGFPRGSLIAGWATIAVLAAIVISRLAGTHSEGHVADVWLVVICVVMALPLARHTVRARHYRRR